MPPRRGRPPDQVLTAALLRCTVDVLADLGPARVTAPEIARRIHAGEGAVRRRWPSTTDLIAAAVRTCHLVPEPVDTGDLRSDLASLLHLWTTPLTRCERAAGAVAGHGDPTAPINVVLDEMLVQPLAAAVSVIAQRHVHRGNPIDPGDIRLMLKVIQSLWWDRYWTTTGPLSPAELTTVVDEVLLPLSRGR